MGQSNEKEYESIEEEKKDSIKSSTKKAQLQKDESIIQFEYITSESILNNLKTHKCCYGYEVKDSKHDNQYNDLPYQPIYFIDSKEQHVIVKILKKYTNSIISKEIVSYINHSNKCLSSYHVTCHSDNIKANNGQYTTKPMCAEFLQSKIAILKNYYRPLSPVLNIAMIGRPKIGKSAFGERWEENKFAASLFGSSNKNVYEKEIILTEQEQIVGIGNDFGFMYDDKNAKNEDMKTLNIDISKIFVRMFDIKNTGSIDYKNMDVIFMCYAINDKKSFQYLRDYLFKNKAVENVVKVIIGLKSEMRNESFYKRNPNYLVSVGDVMEIANESELPYFEISAQSGRNVQFVVIQSIYECWFRCCAQKK